MKEEHVAILLAVYRPRPDWLEEQLTSLNQQTYPHLRLYVLDDASPNAFYEHLYKAVKRCINRFPVTVMRNDQNQGSNAAFSKLLRNTKDEKYVAFCDQDDVWFQDKIKNSLHLLKSSPLTPTLVYTNTDVIDGDGNLIAPTISDYRKRHVHLRGEGLAGHLIYRNFVSGCTILMERKRALSYLPFPKEVVHDHYLAFRAALDGPLDYLDTPQMHYRVHSGSQTGVMRDVINKNDYFEARIMQFEKRIDCFSRMTSLPKLEEARAWLWARKANFYRQKGGFEALWSMRDQNLPTSLFELFGLRLPNPLFRLAIRQIQKGRI